MVKKKQAMLAKSIAHNQPQQLKVKVTQMYFLYSIFPQISFNCLYNHSIYLWLFKLSRVVPTTFETLSKFPTLINEHLNWCPKLTQQLIQEIIVNSFIKFVKQWY